MVLTIETLVVLLAVVAAVATVAARLTIPPAILLVLTGVILALIPGLPKVELAPELVLLLVLPPVIYASAVAMSWRDFRFNLRPIALLAVGCVLFTTVAVAAASHWLLGLAWPVGFVLGAIVSPPDVMAPLSIARRLQLPKRILVILEGEGLANDAAALILYRFAVAAVSAGTFSFVEAVGLFAAIVIGEIFWGIGVGWLMLRLRRWVRDPRIEITLSILTPFLSYWVPEYLGGSGVLATVTTGLYISWNGFRLISAATRLQGIFFWDFFIYLIEGMVLLITGLQARQLIARISDDSPPGHFRCGRERRGDRGPLRLGLSGSLSSGLAFPLGQAEGSIAAMATAVHCGIHRGAWDRFARGGPGNPIRDSNGAALSSSRSHSFPDVFRHSRDPRRPRIGSALGDPCTGA
jgi:monovalent cation/hydrogen antiporter